MMVGLAAFGTLLLLWQGPPQTVPPPAAPATSAASTARPAQDDDVSADALPSNLDRIRAGMLRTKTLDLVDKSPFRFYTNTVAPAPKFSDIVGSFDLMNGPVPGAGMTHSDFLAYTRPKDLYSSAGFTVGDVLRFALLGYGEGKALELIRKGLRELADAKTEADKKAIRDRIDRELASLRGERIK